MGEAFYGQKQFHCKLLNDNRTETTRSICRKAGQFSEICYETQKAGSANQTLVFFDVPESTAVNSADEQTVRIRNTLAEK
jgi:hypothetical protein